MAEFDVKIAGVWTKVRLSRVKLSGAWTVLKSLWIKVSGVWAEIQLANRIPAGAIALYKGATVPTGWTRVSAADGRMIVGAGTSYAVGTTGGSSTTNFSGTTNTTGSHTGSYLTVVGSGNGSAASQTNAAGSHNHTFSVTPDTTDIYKDYILIQATADTAVLPQNTILLGNQTLDSAYGVSNIEVGVNRFVRCNSSFGATGGANPGSTNVASSTNGSHGHGNSNTTAIAASYGTINAPYYAYNGAHNHTVYVSWTLNTKYFKLSAWGNEMADALLPPNAIMMWGGSTPPAGWYLCDGTNGTPDLRDYFLMISDTTSHNTSGGNNTTSWSYSTSTNGSHNHNSGTTEPAASATLNSYHGDNQMSHSHSGGSSTTTIQPYYALTFIMKGI